MTNVHPRSAQVLPALRATAQWAVTVVIALLVPLLLVHLLTGRNLSGVPGSPLGGLMLVSIPLLLVGLMYSRRKQEADADRALAAATLWTALIMLPLALHLTLTLLALLVLDVLRIYRPGIFKPWTRRTAKRTPEV